MNWDTIRGFEGWSNALSGLLADLAKAIDAKDVDERDRVLSELRHFMKNSPDDIAKPLDDLAMRTLLNTVAMGWEEAAADLRTRSGELARYTEQIRTITEANRKAADGIRGTALRSVLDRTTAAIQSIGELKATLKSGASGDTAAVLASLESALKAIQDLKSEAEKIA